ncbi:MAG TPA: aminotransferase class V-fold PLP-dependent enzyme [Thermomicrobiales bacterium]|nr:aminotransferase class V-fold PLP-dependent enzyme [Thermomicrobiales bacterium]
MQVEARSATLTANIYDRIGVDRIINASGATTAVGGTLMVPEAVAAMVEASQSFVVIHDLNARVGKAIAAATGAEAGYVTAGSASGMLLAVAACVTGTDRARAKRLPDTTGMPNEVIIHRCHYIGYEQMFRAPGARLIEIGGLNSTSAWELEAAINERTAAIAWVDSFNIVDGALDFQTVVEIAQRHNVPVIVDAASTLPPASHLTRWIAQGADLVIYSGGKGIRGPQDSGLLAGRKDLIDAAVIHGSPNAGLGRGMKTSKEAIAGLYAALEWFTTHDHDAEFQDRIAQARMMQTNLERRADTCCLLFADPEQYPAPLLGVHPVDNAWNPADIVAALKAGKPPIHCKAPRDGGVDINMHCLFPGEAEQILDRLHAILDDRAGAAR